MLERSLPTELEATLQGGARVLFRPIRPEDKGRLAEGMRKLSPQSRYRRFFRSVDHLTASELRYLTEVDFVDHFAWIAVLADEVGQPAVGVGRWIRDQERPELAEVAVTVGDAYQNKGLGRTILYLLARSAIEGGVRAFRAYALGSNDAMLAILRDSGATAGKWESGVLEVTVPLPEDGADLERTPAPLLLRSYRPARSARLMSAAP